MGKPPGFKSDRGRFELRVRVPKRARKALGRGELWASFPGLSRGQAVTAAWVKLAEFQRLFDRAAGGELNSPNLNEAASSKISAHLAKKREASRLTDQEMRTLASEVLYHLEKTSPLSPPFAREAYQFWREGLHEAQRDLGEPSVLEDPSVQSRAASVAKDLGLSISPDDGLRFIDFCEVVARAQEEHIARALAGMTADRARPDVVTSSSALTLHDAIARFKRRPSRRNLAASTRAVEVSRLSTLVELLGANKLVSEITRQDLNDYVDTLLVLPPNYTKRWLELSLSEVRQLALSEAITPQHVNTVRAKANLAIALFKWLEVEGHLPNGNPAVSLDLPEEEDSQRLPMSDEQISMILEAPAFNDREDNDWLYWLPRLAMFSGLRLKEMAGLMKSDLAFEGGVWALRIENNELRDLKTTPSVRRVPLHPALIDLGFVKQISALPDDSRMFPDMPSSKVNVGHAVGKKVNREIRKLISDSRVTLHSLRHSFSDKLRAVETPDAIFARLGGWTPLGSRSMHSYGSGHPLSVLDNWMSKISYNVSGL